MVLGKNWGADCEAQCNGVNLSPSLCLCVKKKFEALSAKAIYQFVKHRGAETQRRAAVQFS